MTPLRRRLIDDMVTAGLSANTAAHIRAVRGLAKHLGTFQPYQPHSEIIAVHTLIVAIPAVMQHKC